MRCALQRIRGAEFVVYAAHNLADARLLDEATALVEELLGVAAGDHEESCDRLPCGFVLGVFKPRNVLARHLLRESSSKRSGSDIFGQ